MKLEHQFWSKTICDRQPTGKLWMQSEKSNCGAHNPRTGGSQKIGICAPEVVSTGLVVYVRIRYFCRNWSLCEQHVTGDWKRFRGHTKSGVWDNPCTVAAPQPRASHDATRLPASCRETSSGPPQKELCYLSTVKPTRPNTDLQHAVKNYRQIALSTPRLPFLSPIVLGFHLQSCRVCGKPHCKYLLSK